MKKLLTVILILSAFALTACGSKENLSDNGAESFSETSDILSASVPEYADKEKNMADWSFTKEKHSVRCDDILRLFDEKKFGVDGETGALILGKIWALFGEPDDGGSSEVFYLYHVKAQTEGKEPVYLEVDQYNDMPTIRYAEGGAEAAKALAEAIEKASPADYEQSAVYDDYDVKITYSVKNGKAYCDEEPFGMDF